MQLINHQKLMLEKSSNIQLYLQQPHPTRASWAWTLSWQLGSIENKKTCPGLQKDKKNRTQQKAHPWEMKRKQKTNQKQTLAQQTAPACFASLRAASGAPQLRLRLIADIEDGVSQKNEICVLVWGWRGSSQSLRKIWRCFGSKRLLF